MDNGIRVSKVTRYPEEIECMSDNSYSVYKLLNKDSLIEYWMHGKSKKKIIEELIDQMDSDVTYEIKISDITI